MRKSATLDPVLRLQAEVNDYLEKTGAHSRLLLGNDPRFNITRIDTGSLWLNRVLGGGFALGRSVEIFGSESSAKSYIAYMTMALAQSRGKICALIDPEGAFKTDWFEHLGGDPDALLVHRPRSAEEAVKTITMLLRGQEIDAPVEVIAVDSVSALVTMEELEKDPTEGQSRIASQARMMSEGLRRLTPFMENTTILWINQLRTNIGSFTVPNTTSGGRALRFYATTRIQFTRDQRERRDIKVAKRGKIVTVKIPYGNWVQVKSEKEKSTFPYREGLFFFDTERGEIDRAQEILDLGLNDGFITRSGNTYTYDDSVGDKFSAQKRGFLKFLEEDDLLREELEEQIEAETQRLAVHYGYEDEEIEEDDGEG